MKMDAYTKKTLSDCIHGLSPWPVLMIGQAGTGKTCAALCIMDYVRDGRVYRTMDTACGEIIKAQKGELYAGDYPVSESGWWDRWKKAAIVCMDEIGTRERASDFHYSVLKRSIDERLNMPAIFISNLTLDQIRAVYDERVSSRLGSGTVIKVGGVDRRSAGQR
jgi:DNA replication protein DnaC